MARDEWPDTEPAQFKQDKVQREPTPPDFAARARELIYTGESFELRLNGLYPRLIDALSTAYAEGRRQGLEEAAHLAESGFYIHLSEWMELKDARTATAKAIAAAIRVLGEK